MVASLFTSNVQSIVVTAGAAAPAVATVTATTASGMTMTATATGAAAAGASITAGGVTATASATTFTGATIMNGIGTAVASLGTGPVGWLALGAAGVIGVASHPMDPAMSNNNPNAFVPDFSSEVDCK